MINGTVAEPCAECADYKTRLLPNWENAALRFGEQVKNLLKERDRLQAELAELRITVAKKQNAFERKVSGERL